MFTENPIQLYNREKQRAQELAQFTEAAYGDPNLKVSISVQTSDGYSSVLVNEALSSKLADGLIHSKDFHKSLYTWGTCQLEPTKKAALEWIEATKAELESNS